MAKDSEYGAFRLKKETVEFLQTMKQAFELAYGKKAAKAKEIKARTSNK